MYAMLRALLMVFVFPLAIASPIVPPLTVVGCTFPAALQGTYKRQNESFQPKFDEQGIREPLKYEDIYIGPSSAPYWGDCYDSIGDSYILGLKKVGGTMCFRCFTIVAKAENILQVANQGEQYCYRSVEAAKRTCFDSSKITPGDGIMLYRSENVQYQYCPLDGRAQLEYSLGNRLHCPYPSQTPAEMSNCEVGYRLDVHLRGCTFPDVDMTMRCLGTWSVGDGRQKYFAVFNEQVGEYRCGMFADTRAINGRAVAALSNDSSCTSLLNNSTDGFEMFTFYQEQTSAWPAATAECQFPNWLQGKYDTLSISGEIMSYYQHQDQASMMTVNARCVAAEGQRVRVYSKTHCGDPLGYHCLMFQQRSGSVLEFKTTGDMQKNDDANMCKDEKIFDQSSWTTVSAEGTIGEVVPCSHPGHFTTPTELRSNGGDCFNLTTDCTQSYSMRLVAYECESGAIFDSRQYQCIASWREEEYWYTYVTRFSDDSRGCFVSRYTEGRLYMTWTGRQCIRGFNFASQDTGAEQIFVLESRETCPTPTPSGKKSNETYNERNFYESASHDPSSSQSTMRSWLIMIITLLCLHICRL